VLSSYRIITIKYGIERPISVVLIDKRKFIKFKLTCRMPSHMIHADYTIESLPLRRAICTRVI